VTAPKVTGTVTMRDMVSGEIALRGQTEREADGFVRRGVTRDVTDARISLANQRMELRREKLSARITLAQRRDARRDSTTRWGVVKDQINTGVGVARVLGILGRRRR